MFEQNFQTPPINAGYQYNGMPAQNMVRFNNTLTPEQIKRLQQKDSQFSLGLTDDERLRGICNHRNEAGDSDSLVFDSITGEARCTSCGYQFRPIEPGVDSDVIKQDVDRIVDILQTIKLMYIDLPAEAAREYFQIIPLLEKIPQFFEYAAKNMTKHETYNWQYANKNMGTIAMFNNLTNAFGGFGFQNPTFAQQPAGYPYGAYQQPNPFGYNGASMYAPGTNPGFAYAPVQQPAQVNPTVAAPAAPAAPAAAEATVAQTVSI